MRIALEATFNHQSRENEKEISEDARQWIKVMPVQDNRIILIAEAIQCYLRDHPKAADTVEGIAGWWVAHERYQQTQEEIQQALDYLVAKGAMIRNESRNGRIVYSSKEQQRFF